MRETLEETGLEVKVKAFLGIWMGHYDVPADPEPPKGLMNVVYVADVVVGALTPTEEAPEAAWFAIEALPTPLYPEKQAATEALRVFLRTREGMRDSKTGRGARLREGSGAPER